MQARAREPIHPCLCLHQSRIGDAGKNWAAMLGRKASRRGDAEAVAVAGSYLMIVKAEF
jgi:hypothetical protein